MDFLPTNSVLKIRADAVETVRREVNLHQPGEMEEAVRILDEWCHQQAHYMKKDLPKAYLESTIITNKGSVERAKSMIDKLCTLRTLMPEEFRPFDLADAYQAIKGKAHMFLLPKQTEDHYRIAIIHTSTYKHGIMRLFYKVCYMLVDYIRMYDYQRGVDVIYDLVDSDVKEALTNINFMEFKNCYEIVNHSYSVRIRKFYVITSSKWVEPLVNTIKSFMKKKIADRIVILKNHDELLNFYPKDILPKEYGGEEKCFDDLQEEFFVHASSEEHKKAMHNMFEARTDESKRPQHVFNELYAGTAGTFRTLRID